MNRHLQKLQEIFCDVFDDDQIVISARTTVKDIDGWDSLMHITLVIAIEKEFSLKLNASEVGSLENVGRLLDLLTERAG